jgi:hypothetical protein
VQRDLTPAALVGIADEPAPRAQLGLLDDVILVPLGIALCLKLIPAPILADARSRAAALAAKPRSYAAAALIVLVWLAIAAALLWWVYRLTTEAY